MVTAFTDATIDTDDCIISINIHPVEIFNCCMDLVLVKKIQVCYRNKFKSDQSYCAIDSDSGLSTDIEIIKIHPDIRKYMQ